MSRYSPEALKKVRRANYDRWLTKAKAEHNEKFSYTCAVKKFKTQKKPKITICCNEHDREFEVSPHDHLRFPSGGCPDCESELRSQSKFKASKKIFDQ